MKWTLLLGMAAVALLVAAPMTMAADHAKGEKGKGHGNFVTGELKEINKDAKTITVTVKGKEENAATDKVITYTDTTKVLIAQKPTEGGEKPKPKEGTIDDLKTGQKVGVKLGEDGKAAEIHVMSAGSHGGGKHGGDKKGEETPK